MTPTPRVDRQLAQLNISGHRSSDFDAVTLIKVKPLEVWTPKLVLEQSFTGFPVDTQLRCPKQNKLSLE